jgi:hypothetical protein
MVNSDAEVKPVLDEFFVAEEWVEPVGDPAELLGVEAVKKRAAADP